VQVIGWIMAAMSKEDEMAAQNLSKELKEHRACLDEVCMVDEVEWEVEWCHETLSKVLDEKERKIRIFSWLKRCRNGEIMETRSTLGRDKRRGKRSEAAAHAKAELQRPIRQSKSRMWNQYLLNLRGGEVWWAAKFAIPSAEATVEALTDRERKQANTIAEKETMFKGESFPMNDLFSQLDGKSR